MNNPITNVVDCVLLTMYKNELSVALFKRSNLNEPFCGEYALPGGFVRTNEDENTEDTTRRILKDKAGLENIYVEQLQTFSGPDRDKDRGWTICVSYIALVASSVFKDVPDIEMKIFPITQLPQSLPFDHLEIIETAINRVKSKASYSSLPIHMCGKEFTMADLLNLYEKLMGEKIDQSNFRRKMKVLEAIEPIRGAKIREGANAPSQLYRLKKDFLGSTLATLQRGFGNLKA